MQQKVRIDEGWSGVTSNKVGQREPDQRLEFGEWSPYPPLREDFPESSRG